MDKLKLICGVIALIVMYVILLFVGLPFMVAVLGFIIGFIILAVALVVMLAMLAFSLLPFFMLWYKIKRVWRG
jgi:hypothetical protein